MSKKPKKNGGSKKSRDEKSDAVELPFEQRSSNEAAAEKAWELLDQADESDDPATRKRLARKSLQVWPDCADAWIMLAREAGESGDLDEAIRCYREALAAGRRALGEKQFESLRGNLSQSADGGAYMHAKTDLANLLIATGRMDEGISHFQEAIELDVEDEHGVRFPLAGCLFVKDRHEELGQLLRRFADDDSADWAYNQTLLAYRKGGDCEEARQFLADAIPKNRFIPAYLLGEKMLPEQITGGFGPGGDAEAVNYVTGLRLAWIETSGAISWLRSNVDLAPTKTKKKKSRAKSTGALVRLDQAKDETWLATLRKADKSAGSPATWMALIVDESDPFPIGMELYERKPTAADLWSVMERVMLSPENGKPRRPNCVRADTRELAKAWKTKLDDIGVEFELNEDSTDMDAIFDQAVRIVGRAASGPQPVNVEELRGISRLPDATWEVESRKMPTWVEDKGQLKRPWLSVVVGDDGKILSHSLGFDDPTAESTFQLIGTAIASPLTGEPHRPATVRMANADICKALLDPLGRLDIECRFSENMEMTAGVFAGMAERDVQEGNDRAIIDMPGMTADDLVAYFEAADFFFRQKPWKKLESDRVIRVDCDNLETRSWYAVVMGQSGLERGFALYDDLDSLIAILSGTLTSAQAGKKTSALSLTYGEAHDMPARDLDVLERFGCPVAGPEAYPLAFRVDPGVAIRALLRWELSLVEACLRAIPEYIAAKCPAEMTTTVETATGPFKLRLWDSDRAKG